MKTLHFIIIAILLMTLLFPLNTSLAQNNTNSSTNLPPSPPPTHILMNGSINNSTPISPALQAIPPDVLQSLSPLKQFNDGVLAQDVKCKQGFQLVIKAEDSSPACVNPDTAQKLVERGWAEPIMGRITQTSNMSNTKNHDPFGITALVIYHPSLGCLGPPGNATFGCPPNNFYLQINSNSTAYLLGYNICDASSCAKNNTLSVLLPINTILKPNYQMIGLPVNLKWKDGDTVSIQLRISPTDNETGLLIDYGNSTIVP